MNGAFMARSFVSPQRGLLRTAAFRAAGFTLIEIMVVVVILGILAAFIVPNIIGKPEDARVVKAKNDIQVLESALNMYKLDNFYYPSTQQGLDALVTRPSGDPPARNWRGPYIKQLSKDPWDNTYQYLQPGQLCEARPTAAGSGSQTSSNISRHWRSDKSSIFAAP